MTVIEFGLASESQVELSLYNITGRKVMSIVESTMSSGRHSVKVDLKSLKPGVYFYRITTESGGVLWNDIRKLVIE
jgi:hypothetical protein